MRGGLQECDGLLHLIPEKLKHQRVRLEAAPGRGVDESEEDDEGNFDEARLATRPLSRVSAAAANSSSKAQSDWV